jgi:hypothetical protein
MRLAARMRPATWRVVAGRGFGPRMMCETTGGAAFAALRV